MKVEHTFRVGSRVTKTATIGRAEAIKWFCYECMGFSRADIAGCTAPTCVLFVFRGAPPRKLDLTDEQRATLGARLEAGRKRKLESVS